MEITLSNLVPARGATKKRTRVGRGHGSGRGETSGKGVKGQKARTGHHGARIGFEGGQMPMQRRLPKRGFKSPSRTAYHPVNLAEIDGLSSEWSQVGVAELRSGGLVPRMCEAVKLLGGGELSRAVNLVVHAASASAVKKVEQVGGRVTILPSNGRPLRTVR